jgi:hypothetical protein
MSIWDLIFENELLYVFYCNACESNPINLSYILC